METVHISVLNLALGLLLMMIPTFAFYYYRTGIVKDMFISLLRMVIQLFLVGFYLDYLFVWNNKWINSGWLLLMTGICTLDMIKRVKLSRRTLFAPIYLAVFISLLFTAIYFLKGVLRLDDLFDSRYFIPICGILLGNILATCVFGINAFYSGLQRDQQMYYYLLGNGATMNEALTPFIRVALVKTFNPAIASMAVMGLIALPGTMIGQIVGGSSPDLAIRYQIMILVINFASSMLALLMCLHFTVKYMFDDFGRLRKEMIL